MTSHSALTARLHGGDTLAACARSRFGCAGPDLKGELVALAARQRVPAGWVLTCVASLSQVRMQLAGGAEHATWQGPFEIIALTGTLSQDGGHLHLAVADHQGRTVGGHLAGGCTVRTTAEVVLGPTTCCCLPAGHKRLVAARAREPAGWIDRFSAGNSCGNSSSRCH